VERNLSIARLVLKTLGRPESLIEHVEDRPAHDRRCALNIEKIRVRLGWTQTKAMSEGLGSTIEWYGKNADWLGEIRRGEYRTYYEKHYANRSSALDAVRRPALKDSKH
jgi:dTDP-glucose 4,6-dehydratase